MKHIRILGLCLAVAFVMGAVVATSASAEAPEFGRCIKTAKKGGGKFSSAKCTVEKAGGSYEWTPGVVKGKFTTTIKEGTLLTLETVGKTKLTCTGETSTGEFVGTKSERGTIVTLTGCEAFGMPYESAGQTEGTIVTNELEGELGIEKKAKSALYNKVGILLRPRVPEEAIFVISCVLGPHDPGTVIGSVIDPLTTNNMQRIATDTFRASKGKQKPEHFEGEPNRILETSFGEGPYEQTGLTVTMTQDNEEDVEINSVV